MTNVRFRRVLALVLALALAVCLCACGEKDETGGPDFSMVFGCTRVPASGEQTALEDYVAGIVGDVNGDGETIVTIEYIGISNDSNSVTDSGRLGVLLSEEAYTLFLLSDEPNEDYDGISTNYCGQDYFEDLTAYGITPDTDEPQRVTITDTPILTQTGFGGADFYAQVIDRGNDTDMDSAVKVIQDLVG